MLETNYTLNFGQLLKIAISLKKYLWQKLKTNKPQINTKHMNDKTTSFVIPNTRIATVAIDNHMAIIQVQTRKNIIDDMLLDGRLRIKIIIEQLRTRLRLPKLKPTPYNLQMANQPTTTLVGLVKDLRMYVHGIRYITTFKVLQNNVIGL
jgi:hypothetical protein